jgi:hypothetical protein
MAGGSSIRRLIRGGGGAVTDTVARPLKERAGRLEPPHERSLGLAVGSFSCDFLLRRCLLLLGAPGKEKAEAAKTGSPAQRATSVQAGDSLFSVPFHGLPLLQSNILSTAVVDAVEQQLEGGVRLTTEDNLRPEQ